MSEIGMDVVRYIKSVENPPPCMAVWKNGHWSLACLDQDLAYAIAGDIIDAANRTTTRTNY